MSRRTRDPLMPVRLARLHARLLISVAIGAAVTLALAATDWRLATRLLTGWDVGISFYLVSTYLLVSRSTVNEIRRRAAIRSEERRVGKECRCRGSANELGEED